MTGSANTGRWQSVRGTAVDVAFIVGVVVLVYTALVRPLPPPAPPPSPTGTTRTPPPPPVPRLPTEPMSLDGTITYGNASAPVALIEFADFECLYCGKFARETLPGLERKYIAPGRLLFVFRHLPLPKHAWAPKAAEAAECANEQGLFREVHERLFQEPRRLAERDLQAAARAAGVHPRKFEECLQGRMASKVQADAEAARALGISGTPTFFFGDTMPGPTVRLLQRISGAQPIAVFETMIEQALAKPREEPMRAR